MPKVVLAAGLGFEQSMLSVQTINYTEAHVQPRSANRTYYNWAPEMSLTLEAGGGLSALGPSLDGVWDSWIQQSPQRSDHRSTWHELRSEAAEESQF